MSRIVYVGYDGALYDSPIQGAGPRRLTPPGMSYTWPASSPSGTHVAFSGSTSGSNGHRRLGLFWKPLEAREDEPPRLVYLNEPTTDAIAQRTPHYVLWAPDGRRLAFIAQTLRSGLSLFVHEVSGTDGPRRLLDGGPLYLSWSPDSRYLLVHSHQRHFLVDFQRGATPAPVPGTSRIYMAPSWSPVGSRMALLREIGGERQVLLVADMAGGGVRRLAELTGVGAFQWRPGGQHIGLVRDMRDNTGFYQGLWLVAADGSGEERIAEDLVLCFFWSPDGSKAAYITPSAHAQGSIRWAVLDVASGSTRYLADFRPTQEQLIAFTFFDQYAQSHSPWSPDGRQLLFSGALGYQMARGPLPEGQGTGVFVADVEGARAPTPVAQGFFGCWLRG